MAFLNKGGMNLNSSQKDTNEKGEPTQHQNDALGKTFEKQVSSKKEKAQYSTSNSKINKQSNQSVNNASDYALRKGSDSSEIKMFQQTEGKGGHHQMESHTFNEEKNNQTSEKNKNEKMVQSSHSRTDKSNLLTVTVGRVEGYWKDRGEHQEEIQQVELSNQILIMNYIYDNSLDQLKKMNLKQIKLNYLEEFKHIPLDHKISPLILACYLGRLDITKLLLSQSDVEVDFPSNDQNFTPLSAACMSGFYELAEELISKGANINRKNRYFQPPLFFCFSRLEEETSYFENQRLCLKLVDLLLDHGARIDEIVNQKKGYTMLMQFCGVKTKMNSRQSEVNKACIKYLIQNGADVALISKKGKDIFQILSKHPNSQQIINLIKNTKVIRAKYEDIYDKKTTIEDPANKAITNGSYPQNETVNGNTRLHLQQDEFKLEGISRNPTTCCSFFSFF